MTGPEDEDDAGLADDVEDFLRGVRVGEDMVDAVAPQFEQAVRETAAVARSAAARGLPAGAFLATMAQVVRDIADAMDRLAEEFER